MKVSKLVLQNFLSYPSIAVSFESGINAVTGQNAVGKTNLIDGIYFASLGKSSRYNRDKDVITWNTDALTYIGVEIEKKFGKHQVDIYISAKTGKKAIKIDGLPIQKIGEMMGVLNVVFFSPDEISLIKESPEYRRRFMDISLCQQNKTYFYTLQKYKKLLVQRNNIIKLNKGKQFLEDTLSLIDSEFVRCGAYVIDERAKFLETIAPIAKEKHQIITSGQETLDLLYEPNGIQLQDTEKSFEELLLKAREKDLRLEYTTVGPHRDDIKITSNDIDIRSYGSQGQQRSAVLSLKLAETALFRKCTGETPVLILDDVLSELDEKRREALFNALTGIQTLVTCTEYPRELQNNDKLILIKDHKILTEKTRNE